MDEAGKLIYNMLTDKALNFDFVKISPKETKKIDKAFGALTVNYKKMLKFLGTFKIDFE
jgi:hypothetical protein